MDIKELAKKLCDESGCHHKCKEIDECVVMEEAEELLISQDNSNNSWFKSNNLPSTLTNEEKVSEKLLINENKSNNFDVKSNNLPFVLTNEENVSAKGKEIEEIANDINMHCCSLAEQFCGETSCNACLTNFLYNAGYRKQSEGEWIRIGQDSSKCSLCGKEHTCGMSIAYFCPNCGAKMKGGE